MTSSEARAFAARKRAEAKARREREDREHRARLAELEKQGAEVRRLGRVAHRAGAEATSPHGDDPHGWRRAMRLVSAKSAWTESERSTIDTVKRALEKSLEDDEEETTSAEPETAAAAGWKRAFKNARIGGSL